jgi:hypothetical protein
VVDRPARAFVARPEARGRQLPVRAALAGGALVALMGDAVRLLVALGAFLAVRQWVVSAARAALRVTRATEG